MDERGHGSLKHLKSNKIDNGNNFGLLRELCAENVSLQTNNRTRDVWEFCYHSEVAGKHV